METIHLEVGGRVQGVGFRWFVAAKGRELGLRGWVKNRPDGNVEVAAGGDPHSLKLLEAAVARGPDGAEVRHVKKLPPVTVSSLGSTFAITR